MVWGMDRWTVSSGRPKKLAGPCHGKNPLGTRMLNAVVRDQPPGFMKCQHSQCPGNNPTIGVELEYQTKPERDTTMADL
eukprot:12423177-Karenia_brevis.AAC.1